MIYDAEMRLFRNQNPVAVTRDPPATTYHQEAKPRCCTMLVLKVGETTCATENATVYRDAYCPRLWSELRLVQNVFIKGTVIISLTVNRSMNKIATATVGGRILKLR